MLSEDIKEYIKTRGVWGFNNLWYIILFILMISALILLPINFKSMLDFKWHIDYFIKRDEVCDSQRWAAFELETLRYNTATFIHDNDSQYKKHIKQDFKNTYGIITTIVGFIVAVLILYHIIVFVMYIISLLGYNIWKPPYLDLGGTFVFISILIFLIIYIAVSSQYMKKLNDIENDTNLQAYYNVYKILNAVMLIGNMKNVELKYSFEGLDKSTLDQILEKNIASYENIYVSSKVKMLKEEAYKNVDFLKYLTFDKYSAYYLPYFDNVYVNYNMADNKFLEDLYREKTEQKTEQKTQQKTEYDEINASIASLIRDKVTVKDGDYIKYYIDHKDILTVPSKLDDIIDSNKKQATYVYSYFVYFSIIIMLILHIVFHNMKRSTYLYSLAAVFLFCFVFVWIYTQMYFFA
jgi:hypothetical protein